MGIMARKYADGNDGAVSERRDGPTRAPHARRTGTRARRARAAGRDAPLDGYAPLDGHALPGGHALPDGHAPRDGLAPRGGLAHRPVRPLDPAAERDALRELSRLAATRPQEVPERALDIVLALTGAGSARLALAEEDGSGQTVLTWAAHATAIAPDNGVLAPGVAIGDLRLGEPAAVLIPSPGLDHPELGLEWPAIREALVAPLQGAGGRPLGALWLLHHDDADRFDAVDAHLLEMVGTQVALALDLTEEADARARALDAKDMQVADAHHRAKNAIHSAASMLKLEVRRAQSPEACDVLRRAMDRLRAMADVHELLQGGEGDRRQVDLPVLVGRLADGLRRSFPEMAERVHLDAAVDDVSLDPERSMPLALLINEAVTNAYKHAFPDGRTGRIAVDLRVTGHDGTAAVQLSVRDDGVGLPVEGRDGSLGLQLIRGFGRQIGGDLSVTGAREGTTVALRFPDAVRPGG